LNITITIALFQDKLNRGGSQSTTRNSHGQTELTRFGKESGCSWLC